MNLTDHQARTLRLRGQGLLPPLAGDPPSGPAAPLAVVRQSLALQAQDIFAGTLGVRPRSTGTTAAGVDSARFEDRTIVWTWAMRGTLHLLATDDLDWLLPLLGPHLIAAGARRRAELGLDEGTYRRGLRAVRDTLSSGPCIREELGAALAAAGLPAGYSIERHLLYRAALEGVLCMGPDRGAKPTFVLSDDWLGRLPAASFADGSPARGAALARLAERYLAAYAPATPADLVAWSGLPAPMVRAGWDAIADRLVEVAVAGRAAWVPAARLAELDVASPPSPFVRLLPAFDTYLLGHRSRDLILEPAFSDRVNGGGGMIHAVVLVDGCVAGTWQANRKGRRVNITVDPFRDFAPGVQNGVAEEIADTGRFLNSPPALA